MARPVLTTLAAAGLNGAVERATLPGSRRLGLVLGGGGGRGGAHLGVLATLEEIGLPIDLIAGTSIGGLIGLLYAAGYDVAAIEAGLDARGLWRVVGHDPSHLGLLGNRRLRAALGGWFGEATFDDLAIPCAVVATDLVSGAAVTLDRGPLVEAALATMALPGLFPPVARGAALLADGGIVDNLPIDVARAQGADRVIAVDLGAAGASFDLAPARHGPFDALLPWSRLPLRVADRGLAVLMAQVTKYRLAELPPDLLLQPVVATIGTLDLGRIAEGRVAGVAAARAARDELLALRDWRAGDECAAMQAARKDP